MSRIMPLQLAQPASKAFLCHETARSLINRHFTKPANTWAAMASSDLIRRAVRELNQLDDRVLHDIGISRGEIESVVRRRRSP